MSRKRSQFVYDPGAFSVGSLASGGRKRGARRGNRYMPVRLLKNIVVMAIIVAVVAFLSPKVFANPFKSVKVSDGYGEYTLLTKADTVGEIYQSGALRLTSGDTGQVSGYESVSDGMAVSVDRAISVTVMTKEASTTLRMKKGTVRDALAMANVEFDEKDEVSPGLDSELNNGDTVSFAAIDTSSVTKRTAIAFNTVEVQDSSLPSGERKVVNEGQNGYKNVQYDIRYKDGVEVSRTVSGEKVIQQPVDRKIAIGTGQASSGSNTNNNGNAGSGSGSTKQEEKPSILNPPAELDVSRVASVKTMSSTGYSHSGSPTASGSMPRFGTVAVNTSEIPLGTHLYIEGYGYGIAQDTGGFGSNTIDLFFETTNECYAWGRKTVKVYILK